jgi:hypothetical protein
MNGDGLVGSPYATIGHGISQATPGTAVIIHSGTYAGGIYKNNVAGTASAPIWIGGAAGEPQPVIDGGNTGIQMSRAKYVANNTIINPERWLLRILQETTSTGDYDFYSSSNNSFKNNLVYYHLEQLSTYVNIGPNTAPETFIFSNNLWYAHDTPSASTPSLPVVETDGIYGTDPLLADPAGGDYQIFSDSPAFHSGLSSLLVAGDVAGTCYHDPPSIGAYEVPPACTLDYNDDGDVDGADLAAFTAKFDAACLEPFADAFGK